MLMAAAGQAPSIVGMTHHLDKTPPRWQLKTRSGPSCGTNAVASKKLLMYQYIVAYRLKMT
ncbi:hypothetical protein [Pseudomonas sessilinigenes]|uniref:Uncharacterized protein n=1 Tax=Pseudomonas sessilinigenes TaxID=658629 RepID=A0ABX8MMI6_9PSED|nr:hypothetical protein [Pseudomonas sessilinigenes]AZC26619.1 hypothetical protein C4K39_4974 [Pseudomonas sessilinigenes]QXH39386.1 hypothetical protein KSS89_24645 [Pseudomonas sessilinigenes]